MAVGSTEIRNILEALENDIFIKDLSIEQRNMFFVLIRHILSEQTSVDYAFKTSLLTVLHKLRDLDQNPGYQKDNQTYLQDYINEVKPYHTKIREYLLNYAKLENNYIGNSDFDLPAYYDTTVNRFRSPSGEFQVDPELLSTQAEYTDWNTYHKYQIQSIDVYKGGTGYTQTPSVTITGGGGTGATATARVVNGVVTSITMVNKGDGYTTTPTVTIGPAPVTGTTAKAYAQLGNNTLVRTFSNTIRFDRITYGHTIKDWTASTSYNEDDYIRYLGKAYQATASFTSGIAFSLTNLTELGGGEFDNANDRIMALYNPTSGMLGRDLTQLVDGLEYRGVLVQDLNTTYSDASSIEASEDYYDTFISSTFVDADGSSMTLGLKAEDINIDGAAFVDEFSSFAPEEFIPGRVFDTLDIQVYQTAGNDIESDGSGSPIHLISYVGDGSTATFSWASAPRGQQLFVYTQNQGDLHNPSHYTTDYTNQTITLETTPVDDDTIFIYVMDNVGDNEVFNGVYTGDGSTTDFIANVDFGLATSTLVLVDNVETTPFDEEYNNGPIIDVAGDGSDFFKRELTVNGVRIIGAGTVGGQTAVPDAWLEKVGRMFELFTDPNGSGINSTAQRAFIKNLSGDAGTYHAGLPTIQRVARGAGADYTPNFLTDAGIIFWNLTNLFDTHVQNDMVWYLNSTGSGYGVGDEDAQEVIEHVFHTLHMHGLDAQSLKMYPQISADWNTGPLYNAMVEAYDGGFWDSSGYGGANFKTDPDAFEVAAKEYLYLLNFCMFDYSDLWDGDSLAPEWSDTVKTPAGIQANLPLGYALHNSYIAPVISKILLSTIRDIFKDGNTPAQDDPSLAGVSGYAVDFTSTVVDSDPGETLIRISPAPADNSYITIHVHNSATGVQDYSYVNSQLHTFTGGTYPDDYTITLDKTLRYEGPFSAMFVVELAGERLRPANNAYYTGDGSTTVYTVSDTDGTIDPDTVADNDIEVYNNGTRLVQNVDYTLAPSDGSSLRYITFTTAPVTGDRIVISLLTGQQFRINSDNEILLDGSLTVSASDRCRIHTFANHDPLRIRTQVFVGTTTGTSAIITGYDEVAYDADSFDGETTLVVTTPEYTLSRDATNGVFLWVTVNGVRIHPNTDFSLSGSNKILLGDHLNVTSTDVIIATSFTENVRPDAFAFRVGQDILGNKIYKRISDIETTTLSRTLQITDTEIHVTNASVLPDPGVVSNDPGVVYIDGERITYYAIDRATNTLSQLRRGTYGTGAKVTHLAGSKVQDASTQQNVPTTTKIWYDIDAGGQVGPDGSTLVVKTTEGKSLGTATTTQAKFLREKTAYYQG
jgi:hypothetical protein